MVEKIQTLLMLLGIISVLAVVAERVRFPFPILLVIAGLLIALLPGLPEVKLDPELVFLIFLPPLLFSAAWIFPWEDFRSNFLPILASGCRPRLCHDRLRCLRGALAYSRDDAGDRLRARRDCFAARRCRRQRRLEESSCPQAPVGGARRREPRQ